MVGLFGLSYRLNLSRQGFNANVFTLRIKTGALKENLVFWESHVQEEAGETSPLFLDPLIAAVNNQEFTFNIISQRLRARVRNSEHYYPEK